MKGRRAFVTGARGFVGGEVAHALVAAGADVHALRYASAAGSAGITWHEGNLLDQAGLRNVLERVEPELVFHLAAYGARPDEHDRDRMVAVNVTGSLNLWKALPGSTRRVIAAASSREYAGATGPVDESYPCRPSRSYPATKLAAGVLLSALAAEEGRSLVLLRLFGPYGPGDTTNRVIPFTIARLLAGERVPLSDGRQLLDFAYIDDHARAFLLAAAARLDRPAAVFNIGGGDPRTLRSVLDDVAGAIGDRVRDRLEFGALPYRPGDSLAVCADITAARRELGYAPSMNLAEGLARTVAWFRARPLVEAGSR